MEYATKRCKLSYNINIFTIYFLINQGAVILLLGTKEEVPTEPVERPKFVEDMNEEELASAVRTSF